MIYLHAEQYDQAMKIFEELADLGDDQPELKAFGLAGQGGILSLREEYQASDAALTRLFPLRSKLNSTMWMFANCAYQRNRDKLGSPPTPQLQNWIKEQFHKDSVGHS